MKKITVIKMRGCPYCAAAFKAIDEVKKNYAATELEIIDKNLQPALAEKFTDYYYVPSMYVDGKKIYEAHPGETYDECLANVKKVFEVANRSKAVVLLSGGLDSTTCLAIAVKKWGRENVSAVSIFYGQRHAEELKSARAVAKFYSVAHYELDAAEIFSHSNSALLDTSTESLEKSSYAAQIEKNNSPRIATYVPFRNGLFLSMAASFADSLYDDCVELYIGVHSDDAAGHAYADCSAQFIASMKAAIRIGTYEKINLIAPFLCEKKSDVVKVGLELGAPYHLTRSCYERGDKPCGQCATCLDRAKAFELNGVKDPTLDYFF